MKKLFGICRLVVFLFTAGIISTPVRGATVSAAGPVLTINLDVANDAVTLVSKGTTYTFTLTTGSWTGSPWPAGVNVLGAVLTVDASGLSTYSTVSVINSAASPSGNAVSFGNSGVHAYDDNINVLLINSPGQVSFNGTTSFTGSNTISIITEKNILFNAGSGLTTVNGNITLEANQQTTATSGGFVGIKVLTATLQVTGTGTMNIKGKGGDTGSYQDGVRVESGGKIIGGTTGLLTIEGYGGTASESENYGVSVAGGTSPNFSTISSGGGNVTVTGTGGGSGASSLNYGVSVNAAGIITSGSNGSVSVTGNGGGSGGTGGWNCGVCLNNKGKITSGGDGHVAVTGIGGNSSGSLSYGVLIQGGAAPDFSTITSGGGNVTVTGTGRGSGISTNQFGVYVGGSSNKGVITSGGTGSVTVIGTASDATTGFDNYGVYISGVDAKIFSGGSGAVRVTGYGGGSGSSVSNSGVAIFSGTITSGTNGSVYVTGQGGCNGGTGGYGRGVLVLYGGRITSSGTAGTVSVTGTGGNSGGGGNSGVSIAGGTSPNFSTISSGGGLVTVTGTGGGSGASGINYGLFVDEAGIITSGSDGSVNVTGNGGCSSGTGNQNYGVYLNDRGKITSGGAGHVAVSGIGGNSSGIKNYGVLIQGGTAPEFSTITSGGGNVTVTGTGGGTGTSHSQYGVFVGGTTTNGVITSGGTGSVMVTGTASNATTGTNNYGVYISGADAKILSGGSGAVRVTGTGGGTGNSGNNNGISISSGTITSGTNGSVHVTGQGGCDGGTGGYNQGVTIGYGGRITSSGTSGTVTVTGSGGNSGGHENSGVSITGGTSPNFSSISSGGGNVVVIGFGGGLASSSSSLNMGILIGDIYNTSGAGTITSGGSGTVTLDGTGGIVDEGFSNCGVYISGSNASVLSGGTGSVSITGTGGMSDNNDASNRGVFLNYSATITTGTDGSVTVTGTGGCNGKPSRANYGVIVSNGSKITSQGSAGTVTVNGTGGGATYPSNYGVYVTGGTSPNFSTITSGGGNVSVAGTGGGSGTSAGNYGVAIDAAGIITSGSDGSVNVSGNGGGSGGTGSQNYGVYLDDKGKMTSGGAGNVVVTGVGGNSSGNQNYGVLIEGGSATEFSTITSGGGSVTVTGTGGGTGTSTNQFGVFLGGYSNKGVISSGGTGSVTVTGTASNVTAGTDNLGVYIKGADAKILSGGSGAVSVTGTGGGTGNSAYNHGISISAGTITSGTNGSVNVTGQGGCDGGTGSGNKGLQIISGGSITSSGTEGSVTVIGTGSNSSGASNYGVLVNGGTSPNFSTISSGGGQVTITGTGGGSGTSGNNYGVWLGAADATGSCLVGPGGTGSLTINGQGGAASGSDNFGIYIGGTNAKVLSAGNIAIAGTEGGSTNGYALKMAASGSISSTGSGSTVTLTGNSMDLATGTSVSAPDGIVNIVPFTTGVNIDLGSGTLNKNGPLTFTNAALALISADTIGFRSTSSGTITISQDLTASTGSSVKLITQGTGGVIPSATADFSLAGQTLTFGAGTPLNIAINGATVNTGYNQLSVDGAVNLAGAELSLSGTYTPQNGDVFTIVSATTVTGTFNGLTDDTEIDFKTQKLRIDYTSTAVTLTTVVECSNPATGGTIAADQTICSGTTPATITSTANPTVYTGTLQYKWQLSYTGAGGSFDDIASSNNAGYTPGTSTRTAWYKRLARVDCMADWSGAVASNIVTITVNDAFTPGTISSTGQTICYNTAAGEIGNVTLASGGDGTASYSWRSSTDGYTAAISGADDETYTPGTLTQTTSYRRYANDGTCNTTPGASEGTWTVTVRGAFTPGTISNTGQTICYDGDPAPIGSETSAAGGDETIEYKWQANGSDISSSDAATYDPPANLTTTTIYTRWAKDGTCNAFEESAGSWTVTVYDDFTPGTISNTGQTICYNTAAGEIGNETAARGGDGTIIYSWRSSADGYTAAISGADEETYTPGTLTQTTSYRRYANDGTCNLGFEESTGTWTVTVDQYVTPTVSINQTAGTNPGCPDVPVTFTATPVDGGLNPTYEWFKNGISAGLTASYTFNPTDGDEVYVVMTTSVQCATALTATSSTTTMQLIGSASASVSIRATRGPGGQVKFTAYPVNGGATPVYTWYKNDVEIPGVTGPELISTCQTGDEHYVVLDSSLHCTADVESGIMCTY